MSRTYFSYILRALEKEKVHVYIIVSGDKLDSKAYEGMKALTKGNLEQPVRIIGPRIDPSQLVASLPFTKGKFYRLMLILLYTAQKEFRKLSIFRSSKPASNLLPKRRIS